MPGFGRMNICKGACEKEGEGVVLEISCAMKVVKSSYMLYILRNHGIPYPKKGLCPRCTLIPALSMREAYNTYQMQGKEVAVYSIHKHE